MVVRDETAELPVRMMESDGVAKIVEQNRTFKYCRTEQNCQKFA